MIDKTWYNRASFMYQLLMILSTCQLICISKLFIITSNSSFKKSYITVLFTVYSALCQTPCVHGNCTGQNKCSCEDGFGGSACDKRNKYNFFYFVVFVVRLLLEISFDPFSWILTHPHPDIHILKFVSFIV